MKRLANASEPPCRSPSVLARFAGSPAGCGKDGGLELCATSMAAHGKKGNMAELTHEQLWKVCQRKLGDCEPWEAQAADSGATAPGDASARRGQNAKSPVLAS